MVLRTVLGPIEWQSKYKGLISLLQLFILFPLCSLPLCYEIGCNKHFRRSITSCKLKYSLMYMPTLSIYPLSLYICC